MARFKGIKITTKFVLWFLVIALVPLTSVTFISYYSSRRMLEREAIARFLGIADNKANQIETYLHDKIRTVKQLSLMPELPEIFEKYESAFMEGFDSSAYKSIDRMYRPFLTYYQKLFVYTDLLLVTSDGQVIFSAKNTKFEDSLFEIALRGNSELANVFVNVTQSFPFESKISNFEICRESNKTFTYIASPVLTGGDLVGVIIAQMDNREIKKLVLDYSNLGNTGEVLIGVKVGDKVVLITPLRFEPIATFKDKSNLGEILSLNKAISGRASSGISVDYRGKKILFVSKYLSPFRLGMIVKMDINEVFAAAEQLKNTLVATGLVFLFLIVSIAILIAQSISTPIKELTKVSGEIAGGNFSERAQINTKDEIEELAHSFNQMTDKLIEAKAIVEQEKAKVEEQSRLLEKANRELDSFVYTASHDLRAPLRAISSFSTFLQEDCKDKLGENGNEYLEEIKKGVGRMTRLIDDLLTLSRISRIKNPYEDINIRRVIEEVVERIRLDIEQNKVDLKIQKNMPKIRCDRIKIAEVFLNLINNAIKFSSKVREKPKVEIGYADKGEYHEFYVKDNGVGIEPKHHQDIFSMFKRLKEASSYEGTGAGLAIVKRVIEDHGGKVWVESDVGRGATFYFTIPKSLGRE